MLTWITASALGRDYVNCGVNEALQAESSGKNGKPEVHLCNADHRCDETGFKDTTQPDRRDQSAARV